MKYLFFVTFASFVGFVHGQLPMKLKYDEANYSIDSTFVILQSGSKYAAYDLTKDAFAMPFSKSKLFLFEQSNVFAKIDAKSNILSLHFISNQESLEVNGSTNTAYLGTAFPLSADGLVDANGQLTYLYDGEPPYGFPNPPYDWAKQEIVHLMNQTYLINNYKGDIREENFNQEIISETAGIKFGYQKSGVYNFENKSWLIEPRYQECVRVKNTIICSYFSEDIYTMLFDCYVIGDDNSITLLAKEVNQVNDELIQTWYGKNARILSYDNGYTVYRTNEKVGLFYFKMTNEFGSSISRIYFSDLLKNDFTFIAYSEFMDAVLAHSKSDSLLYSAYVPIVNTNQIELKKIASSINEIEVFFESDLAQESNKLIFKYKDTTLMYRKNSEPVFEYYQPIYDSQFSLGIVNNYAIVNDYHFGFNQIPLYSVYGEDSMIVDEWGNYQLVFEYGIEPQGKSYIHQINGSGISTDKMYYAITGGAVGFILQEYYRNSAHNYQSTYVLMDLIGEQIQNALLPNDILGNPEYLKYGYQGAFADTIFIAPNGFDGHLQKRGSDYEGVFYVQGNGQLGIYKPDLTFKNIATNEMFEFIHYHPQLDVTFVLKNDSIWLYSMYDTLSVSKSGQIIYMQEDKFLDPTNHYFIAIVDNGETKYYGAEMSRANSFTKLSIQMVGEYLIINDTGFDQVYYCTECFDDYGEFISTREIRIQPENSSVWRKTENGWQKISPYYAEIFLTDDSTHFIARSGAYYDIIYEERILSDIEARYFYLDTSLKAYSVGDYFSFSYIEDLGFGLKVQFNTDDKYFFMTYDGKAITNADWDDFEFENGKLKAILETQYDIDIETGELILDEYGQPIEVVSGTISFFNFP